jgi:hypothetical protein
MQNSWLKELSRFFWIGLVVAVFGLMLGHLTLL